jgi:hypothetical protein
MRHWRRLTWEYLEELGERLRARVPPLRQRTADNYRIVALRQAEVLHPARPNARDCLANNDKTVYNRGIVWLSNYHHMDNRETRVDDTC